MSYLMAIGTKKGLFTATSDDRKSWQVSGPIRLGDDEFSLQSAVYAVGIDTRRSTPRMLVSADSSHFGPSVWHSDDLGQSWIEPKETAPIAFPADTGASFVRAWQLSYGIDPDVVYAGVEPHGLFRSDDGGASFSLNQALWDHPHRTQWFPGYGGAAIHTVLPSPSDRDQVTVAMSTGGVYQTVDGGQSWNPANQGISAGFAPDPYPEFGQCVHKVARAAGDENRFYAQNHGGVYRTDDGAGKWTSIADDLPCDFGFAIVAHPHLSDTVFNFPVQADSGRFLPQDRLQVQRSDDGGVSWRALTDGLPSDPYFGIVLRDAACSDAETDAGIYFGTRCGDVYATSDNASQWSQVASHLPDVLCVRVAKV